MDQRIRERREKLGLTQGQLAELAAVHQSQVSSAEGGKRISSAARSKILAALTAAESTSRSEKLPSGDISPSMGTLGRSGSLLEIALGHAFDPQHHLLRDAAAVQRAFESIALPQFTATELQGLARQWLDAAAELRGNGTPVTSQAIVATVAVRAMRTH